MKQLLVALAVVGFAVAGCGGEPKSGAASTAPADSTLTQPAAPAEVAPAPTPAAVEKAAAAIQESSGDAAAERGDATLERLAAMPENAQLPAGRWKSGVNYRPIVPAQSTSAEAGQVEVVEVFWYGCSHCYALEPTIESWAKSKPSYIKFVRLPVMWGATHRAHARLFYTLEALGKIEALHGKVFDEIHQRGNFLVANDEAQTLKLQLAFAKANGISEADFTRAYNSFTVNASLQHAEDLTRRYKVEGVPLIVINGKYETDVGMAGSPAQLPQLINDLAAADKRR